MVSSLPSHVNAASLWAMKFSVCSTVSADRDLDSYSAREQKLILDTVERFLTVDADIATRRRKPLRPNPNAPWELTMGRYRVFYEIPQPGLVKLLAIGHKIHNELFIRGNRVEL